MGQTPDELKAGIAGTRADMTATLDAITDRTSPKRMANRQVGRLRGRASAMRDTVMGSVGDLTDTVSGGVGDVTGTVSGGARGATDQMRQAPDVIQRQTRGNPLAAGLIAFGAGLLAASILPATEAEKRTAGAIAEQAEPLVDQAHQAAQEVAGQLQASAHDAAGQLKQTAAESAGQVRDQAAGATAEVAGTARSAASEVKGSAQEQRS